MAKEEVISSDEAKKKILAGKSLSGVTINDSLVFKETTINHDVDLSGVTIKGSLLFEETTIKSLTLKGATIDGLLGFNGVTIKNCLNLSFLTVKGKVDFSGIIKIFGGLYFCKANFKDDRIFFS